MLVLMVTAWVERCYVGAQMAIYHSDILPAAVESRQARVERGVEFLARSFSAERGFLSGISLYRDFSQSVHAPTEFFSSAVIAEALLDAGLDVPYLSSLRQLIHGACNEEGLVHFFQDKALLPPDVDCTGVGHALFVHAEMSHPLLHRAVDRVVSNANEDGIIEVYLDTTPEHRGRLDVCALANVFYLLYLVGREDEAVRSRDFMLRSLEQNDFLFGSRYYPCPDTFLYFLSRITRDFERARELFLTPLQERIYGRFGVDTSCLDRAVRAAAADNVGLFDATDLEVVAHAQRMDGSWPAAPFFRYGRTERYFGSQALSTALAARALMSGIVDRAGDISASGTMVKARQIAG